MAEFVTGVRPIDQIVHSPELRCDDGEPENILGRYRSLSPRAITVRQERCAKVRNRNVSCLKCARACTSGCISIVDDEVVVDASKCVGCGTCATVCPTCCLEANNPNDAQLLAACLRAADGGRVAIACQLAIDAAGDLLDGDRVAPVVCAGRVDESLLAQLASQGLGRIDIVCGHCGACAQRHGRDTADMVVDSALTLLGTFGCDARINVLSSFPQWVLRQDAAEAQAVQAAEGFFSQPRACETMQQEELEEVAAGTNAVAPEDDHQRESRYQHVMKDGTLPHFLPDRRERLMDALSTFEEPDDVRIKSRLWGMVVIDATRCVSCRMCATFCPTGALRRFDDADGEFGVEHYPGDCVKCGSCVEVCPGNAILMFDDVRAGYLLDGETHRYRMRPRGAQLGTPHQILDHMKSIITDAPNMYER